MVIGQLRLAPNLTGQSVSVGLKFLIELQPHDVKMKNVQTENNSFNPCWLFAKRVNNSSSAKLSTAVPSDACDSSLHGLR